VLIADSFPRFFAEVHGFEPFPWQSRLARQVAETGVWPELLDLPTGTGKTSVLDIAVWAMALDAQLSPASRRMPRRVVLVVDRRIVVDQGYVQARLLASALQAASGRVTAEVAALLRSLWNGPSGVCPIETAVLRGGMPRTEAWAHRPDRPLLAASTVDQVGSRLLFRGYGVSQKMASVHAGLLGNDTLLLLDEVHLSGPFAETLTAIATRLRSRSLKALPDRWRVVRMSATPGTSTDAFRLSSEDRAHPVLARRLSARKHVRLREVPTQKSGARGKGSGLVSAVTEESISLLGGAAKVGAIVVNRVDTARETARSISTAAPDDVQVVLLTGRMRPLDRDDLMKGLAPRIMAGRDRGKESGRLIVVATQCIEAGADFDFDFLVTECASLDALRQRFGRLDRTGSLGRTEAVIVAETASLAEDDPIYGKALKTTWEWLKKNEDGLDFGLDGFPSLDPDEVPALLAERSKAPFLLPVHCDLWSQTSPVPFPDPDVSLWLHGTERGTAEVQIVWRADVVEEDLESARGDSGALAILVDRVAALSPGILEALSIPLYVARAWLRSDVEPSLADLEGVGDVSDEVHGTGDRFALGWRGDESVVIGADEVRPGETLVVPASRGGISMWGFDPKATEPVSDLAERANWLQRGRAILRLDVRTLPTWFSEHRALVESAPLPGGEESDPGETASEIAAWLVRAAAAGATALPSGFFAALKSHRRFLVGHGARAAFVLVARKRSSGVDDSAEVTSEDDSASFTARQVTLGRHLADVEAKVAGFARSCGLPQDRVRDLALAGALHDLGKSDPRFQKMLVGGSDVKAALLTEPLAKSPLSAADSAARRQAQVRAGYPQGFRHELVSVALVKGWDQLEGRSADPELVLHLVASHHGWCRPFPPALDDAQPVKVSVTVIGTRLRTSSAHGLARLDSGIVDRYWRLIERYGWWGLAWMEAILRLADHRASEEN
jgi:CRISPR-associated endonuclease/helicase Cas3